MSFPLFWLIFVYPDPHHWSGSNRPKWYASGSLTLCRIIFLQTFCSVVLNRGVARIFKGGEGQNKISYSVHAGGGLFGLVQSTENCWQINVRQPFCVKNYTQPQPWNLISFHFISSPATHLVQKSISCDFLCRTWFAEFRVEMREVVDKKRGSNTF